MLQDGFLWGLWIDEAGALRAGGIVLLLLPGILQMLSGGGIHLTDVGADMFCAFEVVFVAQLHAVRGR